MKNNYKQFEISDHEFKIFRDFIYDASGINLSDEKRTLVLTRLRKRLNFFKLNSFTEYFNQYVSNPISDERQVCIDLLTTNETYFFREPAHFDFLTKLLNQRKVNMGQKFRVWSAASSSGEEAFSIAMVLDDILGHRPWEIVGTDISAQIILKAQKGHYSMSRIEGITKNYLQKYCLKGTGKQEGTMLMVKSLREKIQFLRANLKGPLPNLGEFDLVFLRNVLIYFDNETKATIIRNLIKHMKPGAYLLIGHSETLKHIKTGLDSISPSIYRLAS